MFPVPWFMAIAGFSAIGDTKLADASLDAGFAVGTFTLTGSGRVFSCDTGSMLNCSIS
jgi:hypothetical protein